MIEVFVIACAFAAFAIRAIRFRAVIAYADISSVRPSKAPEYIFSPATGFDEGFFVSRFLFIFFAFLQILSCFLHFQHYNRLRYSRHAIF